MRHLSRRAVAFAAIAAALVTAAAASSRPAAGITITAQPPTVALLQADRASGTSAYGLTVTADFTPEALHHTARVRIEDLSGRIGTDFVNLTDEGNNLHSDATHRWFFGAFAGTRYLVTATWTAYDLGGLDGRTTSPPTILEVPKPEPRPRLSDQEKQRLKSLATSGYRACAALAVAGVLSIASGIGIVLTAGLGVATGAVCVAAYEQDRMSRDPVDLNFRAIAKPKTPTMPKVVPGEGLSPAAAAAINKLVSVQAQEIGLARAITTSWNRSQGAHVKKQTAWERKQVLASGTYAARLSSLMLAEAKLRPGVRATLAALPSATYEEAYAFGETLARGAALPSALASTLAKLGQTKADRGETRAQLTVIDPGLYDGSAGATLADRVALAHLRQAAASLKAFSKRAARNPLETGP